MKKSNILFYTVSVRTFVFPFYFGSKSGSGSDKAQMFRILSRYPNPKQQH